MNLAKLPDLSSLFGGPNCRLMVPCFARWFVFVLNVTPCGAEVDVDGLDGERVFVRVADCSYAVGEVRG